MSSTKNEKSKELDIYELLAEEISKQRTRNSRKLLEKLIAKFNKVYAMKKGKIIGEKELEDKKRKKGKRQKALMAMVAILIFGSIFFFLINKATKKDDTLPYCSVDETTIVLDSIQIKMIVSETKREVGEWRTNKIIETLYLTEMDEANAFAMVDSLILYAWK